MKINQYTHDQINNSTKKQNTAGEINPNVSSNFDDVFNITKETQMISAADQSHAEHLTLNKSSKPVHGSENVAIFGTLMVADPSKELRENTFSKFTSREHHLAAFQNESYMDAANDPEKIMNESYADYQVFMEKAQTVANKLEDINSTNTMDIYISAYGEVNLQWKRGVFPTDQSMMEKDAINQWISKNTATLQELKSLGSRYALSKSMYDYEAATGISHETLVQNSERPFEGEVDSSEVYSRKLYEYATKMMRYSKNSFGVNPISYSQVDQHVELDLPLRSRSLFSGEF